MNRRLFRYAAGAVILISVCLPANNAAAQQLSLKKESRTHACASLIRPTLYQARRMARKLAAKDIQARILDITKELGREVKFQEALECLQRHQEAR